MSRRDRSLKRRAPSASAWAPDEWQGAASGGDPDRREARRRRRQAQTRRRRAAIASVAVAAVVLLVAGLVWYRSPARSDAAAPLTLRSEARASEPVFRPSEPEPQLTPYFASYKGLKLRVPIAVESLTEVGFHQASYDWALPLKSLLPDADAEKAKKNKQGTHRDITEQETGEDAVLVGKVLRMWRTRPGKPNTAIDVGAKPGTTIMAPVDGTVVLVKRYNLYNNPRYRDYQVHIQPDGRPELDLVMIHVAKPKVKAGDRVMAGASPIGEVRKFSHLMNLQLEHYTKGGGDHTHLQINDATDPEYEGLKGAVSP